MKVKTHNLTDKGEISQELFGHEGVFVVEKIEILTPAHFVCEYEIVG